MAPPSGLSLCRKQGRNLPVEARRLAPWPGLAFGLLGEGSFPPVTIPRDANDGLLTALK